VNHLIISNGCADVCAAEAIRELNVDTSIVRVSDESFPSSPYYHPMLGDVLESLQPLETLPVHSPYRSWHIGGRTYAEIQGDRR
jgi:hypothetical protein